MDILKKIKNDYFNLNNQMTQIMNEYNVNKLSLYDYSKLDELINKYNITKLLLYKFTTDVPYYNLNIKFDNIKIDLIIDYINEDSSDKYFTCNLFDDKFIPTIYLDNEELKIVGDIRNYSKEFILEYYDNVEKYSNIYKKIKNEINYLYGNNIISNLLNGELVISNNILNETDYQIDFINKSIKITNYVKHY